MTTHQFEAAGHIPQGNRLYFDDGSQLEVSEEDRPRTYKCRQTGCNCEKPMSTWMDGPVSEEEAATFKRGYLAGQNAVKHGYLANESKPVVEPMPEKPMNTWAEVMEDYEPESKVKPMRLRILELPIYTNPTETPFIIVVDRVPITKNQPSFILKEAIMGETGARGVIVFNDEIDLGEDE